MEIILAIIVGAILLGLLKFLSVSTKIIVKLAWNGVVGLITLFIFNIFSGLFGVNIELTFVNALIAGVFGIPGILILLLFN